MDETLGVLAHRGGLLVQRPELSVGVVRAISRPTGLELELLARRPLDRRSATERQADIRAGRDAPPVAPRRLLPPFDEGTDLRVGWLDKDGRAHWEFGSCSASSGDYYEGTNGQSLHTVLHFPPLFDHVSVVLAWPEIGFPETVVGLALPDQAAVESNTVSIWDAPLHAKPVPDSLNHRVAAFPFNELAVEAGRVVAVPQVLSRGEHAVVVLTRLTAVGAALSMEILSVAKEERAHAIVATVFPPSRRPPSISDDPEQIRTCGPGASIAMVQRRGADWVRPQKSSSSGGSGIFRTTAEFTVSNPDDGVLDLVVSWPAAGLPDVCAQIPVSRH
jgi:hypothetical protein